MKFHFMCTLSLSTKSYGMNIHMKPLRQYLCTVLFVANYFTNEIWNFC